MHCTIPHRLKRHPGELLEHDLEVFDNIDVFVEEGNSGGGYAGDSGDGSGGCGVVKGCGGWCEARKGVGVEAWVAWPQRPLCGNCTQHMSYHTDADKWSTKRNPLLLFTPQSMLDVERGWNPGTMGDTHGLSNAEANQFCVEPDPSTKDFIFQQTMYRIKDPRRSLEFYTQVLGMRLLQKLDFPDMKFSLYFMGFEAAADIPVDPKDRTQWTFSRKATLELTHNWGTESDPDSHYHNGNEEPRGFGHIGIMVPNVDAACERFEKLNVEFVKRPNDGKMKGIAFIKDPDGYWIEILNAKNMAVSV
uniref:lactoylglutathione lyase n=2 Tax=Timema TaxID=61471 RepID=A0A7R9G218_TIMSH|nr:unnamed protein product [Timema shepardi]